MMEKEDLTRYIKSEAIRLGFDICGIAKAEAVAEETAQRYNKWIGKGNHATMQYLERNCDKRFDPTLLVEGCKSIISVAMNYAPKQPIDGFADYALGKDYHKIVKERLYRLLQSINDICPVQGRAFCDSAPVLERYWAVKAGIGYIGRNRQLIIPGKGSAFFLGELLVDIELCHDTPLSRDFCGICRKCIESCPGGALSDNGLDANKCLSYLTIEHRGELPENIGKKMGNCFYGCDRCRTVCPHNRFSTPNTIPELQPSNTLRQMTMDKWQVLTKPEYKVLFKHSAVERCGYEQLMRNINALEKEDKTE
jgi:epoxyqueuosine reductase